MNRIFYSINQYSEIEEHKMDLAAALERVDSFVHYLKESYDLDAEMISASMFGYSHENRNNFIEVSLDGKAEFRVKLEFQLPKKLWFLKWNGLYQVEKQFFDVAALKRLVTGFYQNDLADFKPIFEAAEPQ
jgi:hypothetical protein